MEKYEDIKKHVNILLVDDDVDYIEVTAFFLKSKGYNVDIATNGEEGIRKVKEGNIHIVLLDYYMPGLTGEDVINKVREFNKEIIIILQTGFSGQQPPAETLQRLNIQNYHDKSDGADKLLLQVMSAVRIFNQQNEIQLSKYRVNAIGKLIKGIAEDMKSPLMSISAGIEASNALIEDSRDGIDRDTVRDLKKFYENNKTYLEKIDKVLSAIILQTNDKKEDEYLVDKDILERIDLILSNEIKTSGVLFEKEVTLKPNTFIHGHISDVIFIVCELLNNIMNVSSIGDSVKLSLKEDESFWYICIENSNIPNMDQSELYLINNIICTLEGVYMEPLQDRIVIGIDKKI